MNNNKNSTSTFKRLMKDKSFEQDFVKEYQQLLISELVISIMEQDGKSVRKLAEAAGVSPTVVQKLRTGNVKPMQFEVINKIFSALGIKLLAEFNGETYSISV